MISSTPSFQEFDPRIIPYQERVIDDVYNKYDYSLGTHEILLSGSVGSSKSLLMAHLICRHAIENSGARVLIGRKAMPDLKRTIFQTVIEHLEGLQDTDVSFEVNEVQAAIYFSNGSEIISTSWADKKYKKVRSLALSMAAIEELTENNEEDMNAYMEIKMRVNRLPHIKENIIISATNPGEPDSWQYKYFMESKEQTRHVYYSVTKDNPFLPRSYVDQLLRDLDPKMAERMIFGKWISIVGEGIYYQYNPEKHEPDYEYTVDQSLPIHFSYDFNIGHGKPLSVCFYQIKDGVFHFFDEVVIEGIRTDASLEEAASRGLFDYKTTYYCHGDATATHRDTRSKLSDYEIIDNFFRSYNKPIQYIREVPASNPPVRQRHNTVNAYLLNNLGEIRIKVYPKCKVLREGFKLTKLMDRAEYTEDDSKFYQHITTAAGYGICWHDLMSKRGRSTMREL